MSQSRCRIAWIAARQGRPAAHTSTYKQGYALADQATIHAMAQSVESSHLCNIGRARWGGCLKTFLELAEPRDTAALADCVLAVTTVGEQACCSRGPAHCVQTWGSKLPQQTTACDANSKTDTARLRPQQPVSLETAEVGASRARADDLHKQYPFFLPLLLKIAQSFCRLPALQAACSSTKRRG